MKLFIATLLTLSTANPVIAGGLDYRQGERSSQPGYSYQEKCYKRVYREEYIPGTMNNPGRVVRHFDKVETRCKNKRRERIYDAPPRPISPKAGVDDNSCIEGTILGGLAGGAIGGVAATKENWIWSIPAGIIGGAMAGCQVDGG
jgi:hypothetical protein